MMFCFVVIIVVIFIYLLIQKDSQRSSKYLAATLIAYVAALFSMIFYVSKDNYYYNVVNNYFSLPKTAWKYLMFVNVSKDLIIRILNFSSLAVVYFGYRFSESYQQRAAGNGRLYRKRILPVILLVQLILYEPLLQYRFYLTLYPDLLSLKQIDFLTESFHLMTMTFNFGVILFSILRLFLIYRRVYYLQFLRSYLIGEGICYTLIMISYIVMFWFSPASLVKVSKIADFISYRSVPLSSNQFIYTAYPYYLIITAMLCAFCIYRIANIKKKMRKKDFTITKQIDAADTTSKIFCHYMKNELLAIQSQIELLQTAKEEKEDIKALLERCDNLYQRLDAIHRSTRRSELNLVETDLKVFIQEILTRKKSDIHCPVQFKMEDNIAEVMIDTNYFEQAVVNILENALDSMESLPREQRKLIISLQTVSNWVILSIKDCGIGISEKNMKNIFTPLYSSKPIARHWGIGLALTYRIITAHEGKIEVESQEKQGTDFRILLPDLKKYIY